MKNKNTLKHIANLIKNNYSSGYYPFWELSFGKYYCSWQVSDKNKKLISDFVLSGDAQGEIMENINKKQTIIIWKLAF